jgi:sugar lactone lactonase YvrE
MLNQSHSPSSGVDLMRLRFLRQFIAQPCSLAVLAVLTVYSLPGVDLNAQGPDAARVATQAKDILTLDPAPQEELAAQRPIVGASAAKTPENFRQFDAVSQGQIGDTKTLTLRFGASAKLVTIKSTPEFKVEQGGSCVEGFSYTANSTCTLRVRSTPQGPGHRLGKLEITNSVDAKPLFVGLGGYGYSPTISFTPSLISTVPGTYVAGAGLVAGSSSLAVDGGDTLYIADTGNGKVESMDSSGTIVNTTSFIGIAPVSVVVDHSGYVYFTERTQFYFLNVLTSANSYDSYASGTAGCAVGATCNLGGANFYLPGLGSLALDPNGTVFLNTYASAARFVPTSEFLQYIPLVTAPDFNNDNGSAPQALAVDGNDTLYTYYNAGNGSECAIQGISYYNAESSIYTSSPVAGSLRACGFSGDGGQARGAEIGKAVGQMTFDIAGNFYFSDTTNQRVRRIDASTGIITTIAGNGSVGYAGDGGPATSASLNTPTGVAVDSQGQVYILSNAATTGTTQVVRKVGVVGALNLGGFAVGTASTAQTVQLANTGNSDLDFTHVGFSSGNTSDFVIDPNTTTCNFTVALSAGRSCRIGFIFTPSATGARAAVLSITDDTIAGINTIQLSGTGYTTATLTPASLSYTTTSVGTASAAQTATLTNTGKAAMAITSILISGTNATSFTETTTCGTALAVGATCTVSVTFKPTATGALTATLTVNGNALGGRQTVALSGTAVAAAATALLSPTSLTFASTTVGVTSAGQTVTLSNSGGSPLSITSIGMTGADPADFPLTKTCGSSVAAGGSCTIAVSFKPAATGARTATVSVVTSVGTVTATVTGTGVAAATKVGMVSAVNPSRAQTVLLAATVSSAGRPTGTIQLKEGVRVWAEASLANGVAAFRVQGMTVGVHMLHAVYLGDKDNLGSSSAELRQMVQP